MAEIVAGFGTSHVPAVGAAIDKGRQDDPYWAPFFAKVGEPPFVGYADPLAVADVRMECRRDAAGDWKISLFDSGQIFRKG